MKSDKCSYMVVRWVWMTKKLAQRHQWRWARFFFLSMFMFCVMDLWWMEKLLLYLRASAILIYEMKSNKCSYMGVRWVWMAKSALNGINNVERAQNALLKILLRRIYRTQFANKKNVNSPFNSNLSHPEHNKSSSHVLICYLCIFSVTFNARPLNLSPCICIFKAQFGLICTNFLSFANFWAWDGRGGG